MRSRWSSVAEEGCQGVPERLAGGRRRRGPPFPCVRLRDSRGQYDAGPRWAAVRGLWFDSGDRAPCGPRCLDQSHVQPPTDATLARPPEWNRSARRPCQTAGHRGGLRPFHLIYIAREDIGLGTDSGSWVSARKKVGLVSAAGFEPATHALKGR